MKAHTDPPSLRRARRQLWFAAWWCGGAIGAVLLVALLDGWRAE